MLLTHCLLFLSNKVGKLISKDTVVVTAGHKVGFGLLLVMLTGRTKLILAWSWLICDRSKQWVIVKNNYPKPTDERSTVNLHITDILATLWIKGKTIILSGMLKNSLHCKMGTNIERNI